MQQKIQLLEKQVQDANQTVRISEELDRNYKKLTGIAILDTIGFNHTIISSSVEGKELFPKNFETAFLQTNVFVAPDDRFFTLHQQPAEGNKIELEFKDGGNTPSYPYTLKIYLRLEDAHNN